jgi:glycine/D-amino acid oxidase-like deaminating enzyme
MYSYWEKKYWFGQTDFTIVGSGIVGLLTAIYLKQKHPKASIKILEREAVPKGASTKNAGFACFGTIGELLDDLTTMDEQEVANTLALRYKGLELLRSTVSDNKLGFKLSGGYEVFSDLKRYEQCAEAVSKMNRMVHSVLGLSHTFQSQSCALPNTYSQMICNQYEGELNPVYLVLALREQARALGVNIYSGFVVEGWEKAGSKIEISLQHCELQLKTKTLVLATNAFTNKLLAQLDVIPKRNQVLVSQPLGLRLDGTYHYDKGYVYFRNIDNRVLIGGARNIDPLTESTSTYGSNDKIVQHLTEFAQRHIASDFEVQYHWSGIIATGSSKSPIVKEQSENVFVAARLGGMGVAIGAQVAKQVVDLLG